MIPLSLRRALYSSYRLGRWLVLAALLVVLGVVLYWRGYVRSMDLSDIRLPRGFEIAIYADSVPDARAMALGDSGTIFVGSRSAGNVYALRDTNGDFRADQTIVILSDLNMPSGVAFRNGALYVADIGRIIRLDSIESRLETPPEPAIVTNSLPSRVWHGWKYLRFGPDGKLYLPVGVPCNICDTSEDERFGTILRMNPDGTELDIFARGVRNSVGFDWHPRTGDLWFTDNGRDMLGNNGPPDELNHAPAKGLNFGFPYCHAGHIVDREFGAGHQCVEFVPPVQDLDPHVAALGMRFYSGSMFPVEYRGQVFIAEHGSWNRVPPSGYRITRVRLDGDTAVEYEVFADGWLKWGASWGRPVDILMLPDGSLLVSDDRAGMIYRITYPWGLM
ncbi:MAG: PQQ-dependent sugar dehydrogenase [Gemmatimonadales bacterium]